ncbi:MAG: hypothetical protein ABIF71_13920 [Planctomycetota bacterium]
MADSPRPTQAIANPGADANPLTNQDLEEIKYVKAVMKHCATAEKTYRLYPPSNVNVREAAGHFTAGLAAFFNQFKKPIVLKVTQTQFLYRDQSVYENTEKDKSLTFRLYIDGVRGIAFAPGAEEKEAHEFLGVYLELSLIDPLENDFVSLFWERGFQAITIAAIDVFRDENGEEIPANFMDDRDFLAAVRGADTLGAGFAAEKARAERKRAAKAREQSAAEREVVKARADVFKFTEAERRQLKRFVDGEMTYESVHDFIDVVFTLFRVNRDAAIFPTIISVIGKTIQGFVLRYQFRAARTVLQRTRALMRDGTAGLNAVQADIIRKMIRGLGDQQLMEMVNHHLKNAAEGDVKDLFGFLGDLEGPVLPDIFELIKGDKYTAQVVELFIRLGAGQYDFIRTRFGELGAEVDVLLLDVLVGIDLQKTVPLLIERMNDADVKVRGKCIKILLKHDIPELREVFRTALADANENNQLVALRYYNGHACPEAFPILLAMFKARGFTEEKSEKQQFIVGALVKADLNGAFTEIANILTARPFWGRKKHAKVQKDLLRTLGGIDALEVAEVLLRLYEDENLPAGTREHCRTAITAIRARTINVA